MPAPKFTPMLDYTEEELNDAIREAIAIAGGDENFYTMLRGIDAYMEKRKRKTKKHAYGED